MTVSIEILGQRAEASGLSLRGSFHPVPDDGVPPAQDGAAYATLVLVGFAARRSFEIFTDSPEAHDGGRHPLDRWSRRVIDALAAAHEAAALYPFVGPPWHPFQRWAQRAEDVFVSPLGILIHPEWGLWHSYRGALAFRDRLEIAPRSSRPSPCASCAEKPCLTACPVEAFSGAGYDVAACAAHVAGPAGSACMSLGCLARRACPIGASHRYDAVQASFYMRAFRASRPAV